MLAEERRQKILELLTEQQRIVAKDLAEMFQISVDSIRRDLTIMEEQRLLKKTYGGAIPLAKVRTLPQPELVRYGDGSKYQNAISRLAVSYIQENDTVFIGGAGIHYGMIKYIPNHLSFTVVTNSLKIADTLRKYENIETYLTGGKARSSSSNIIDATAIEQISNYTLDLAFLTGGGISVNGISTATPEGASFTRAVNDVSRRKICLAPHEKLGVNMFARSISLNSLESVITDEEAPMEEIQALEKKGIKVIIATSEEN